MEKFARAVDRCRTRTAGSPPECGQTMPEYGVLIAILTVATIAILAALTTGIASTLASVVGAL